MPAHDEEETIGDVVARTRKFVDRVLVVDDGSRDRTGDRAREAGATVVRLDPNRGKGYALDRGIGDALDAGATSVVTIDADGEHVPEEIPRLLDALRDADVVLGARNTFRTPARRVLNGFARFWFRLLDPAIEDTICGFRAFRSEALPQLRGAAPGFAYEHEVILRALASRLRIASVPVEIRSRARTHVDVREIFVTQNAFGRNVLARLEHLPIAPWRKAVLAVGCSIGLAIGTPIAWTLDVARAPSR
jgi:glycosyltransferase involved in cell wall biosynthesis